MVKEIWVVRHPAFASFKGLLTEPEELDYKMPISQTGLKQARLARNALEKRLQDPNVRVAIFSSPYKRAFSFSKILSNSLKLRKLGNKNLASLDRNIRQMPELSEVHFVGNKEEYLDCTPNFERVVKRDPLNKNERGADLKWVPERTSTKTSNYE